MIVKTMKTYVEKVANVSIRKVWPRLFFCLFVFFFLLVSIK